MASRRWASACALAVFLGVPASASDKPEDTAQVSADSWLKLVDDGKYETSWDQAAKLFKGAVTKDQWKQAAAGVRGPLGKLVSRKVKSRAYTETVPGGPDGKYVIIQYEAAFEKKAAATETVTPMLDPDGTWRVSGYFIR
jgi:Protein of unknown function (DUF4019)